MMSGTDEAQNPMKELAGSVAVDNGGNRVATAYRDGRSAMSSTALWYISKLKGHGFRLSSGSGLLAIGTACTADTPLSHDPD